MIDKLLGKLEGRNIAQNIILLILTPLPLLCFADTNTDWSDVISKPMSFGYLFFCWLFSGVAYTSQKINTKQKSVPIKAFLIAIGFTTFIGFNTYHGINFSSGDYDYEYDDPYAEDARIWRLQSKIEKLYGSIEDSLVDREEVDQIRTLEKQIKQIKENNRHNQAVANYIFYTLSIYVGLLLGRGGKFEKKDIFKFLRRSYARIGDLVGGVIGIALFLLMFGVLIYASITYILMVLDERHYISLIAYFAIYVGLFKNITKGAKKPEGSIKEVLFEYVGAGLLNLIMTGFVFIIAYALALKPLDEYINSLF